MSVSNETSLETPILATSHSNSNILENNSTDGKLNNTEAVLKDKIEANPLDILGYIDLIRYYESTDQFEKGQNVYNKLHERFPLYSPLWVIQLKGNLLRDEFVYVEKLLAQCLSGSDIINNDLSLWMTYLDYVRRKNNLITGGQEARSIIIQAFDMVMNRCAIFEPHSSPFWNDYLTFLEAWKPMNKWEEQQKVDMIRRLYKKMLVIPLDNLETMWNKYIKWEQEINNLTARKFIGELSADYMKARSLYQEWSNLTTGLRRVSPVNINTCNKNNIPQIDQFTTDSDKKSSQSEQIQLWSRWIEWEKENKLTLSEEKLNERLMYVYQQSIQYMIFTPEVWYNYVMYIPETDLMKRIRILNISIQANPSSPTLVFKLTECYELENNVEQIKKSYESAIDFLLKQNRLLQSIQDQGHDSDHIGNADLVDVISNKNSHLNKIKEQLTFIYCIYMNTMKRLSGLSAARAVFSKCRKLKNQLTHHIYIENAYLEFQNQNDHKTACKVLELGLKYFQNDGEYIIKYMDFLILINKDAQIKQLFETSLDKVEDNDHVKQIFKRMIGYESKFGNLNNVYALEKRFLSKYPNENLIELFTDRYRIQNENYIKRLELIYLYDLDKEKLKLLGSLTNKEGYSESGDEIRKRRRASVDKFEQETGLNKRQNNGPHIPNEIIDILRVLPKRQYFKNTLLDPKNLIDFLVNQTEIPEH